MKWFYPVSTSVVLTVLVLFSCWAVAKIDPPAPTAEVMELIQPKIGEPNWLIIVKGYQFGKTGNYVAFTAHRKPEIKKNNVVVFYNAGDGKEVTVIGDCIIQEQ